MTPTTDRVGLRMARTLSSLILATVFLAPFARGDEPTDDDLKKKPITTLPGEVGDLLRKWRKEGTAAGNLGDKYDNRDGGRSGLDTALTPSSSASSTAPMK